MLGWTSEERAPGEILASNRKGQHAATVAIRFDTGKFSIDYRNSARLDYDPSAKPRTRRVRDFKKPGWNETAPTIHKLYNRWVRELERAIQDEVSAR